MRSSAPTATSAPTPPPPRGRPRSARSHAATLAAAYALLIERGYAAMSIEAVAARAGVGKATIYRGWPSRAALALDAFFAATAAELAFPDLADARAAFAAQVTTLADLLRGPAGDAFAAIVAGARHDPALARAIGERWVRPRSAWGRARLERAVTDGQTRSGIDLDAALSALYSAVYSPLLLGRGVEPPERLAAMLDIVLRGIFEERP